MTTDISTGYEPHPFQLKLHRARKRFNVFPIHRRFGKTVFSVNELIEEACTCKKFNPRFAYIAPLYRQAKNVAWDMIKQYSSMIPGVKYNESELTVSFEHNSAKITLYGADNPDALRGIYLDGCVIDETKDIKPTVWTEVIRPALADRKGWCIFVGTPKGLDLFYELYMRALSDPEWCAMSFGATETNLPWLGPEELADARKDMTETAYRQEFECDFTASVEDALIPITLVEEAKQRRYTIDQYDFAAKVMGVDVARFGDDSSSIAKRQGLVCSDEIIECKGKDNMEFASIVHVHIIQWLPDAVFIDAGQGQGVIDRLRQLGHDHIIEVPFGGKPGNPKFTNKRSEMWYKVREWLQDGGSLIDDKRLISDLVAPIYDFDSAGRIQLEKKKDMKKRLQRSPDLGDAFALTFAQPVEKQNITFGEYKDQQLIEGQYFRTGVDNSSSNNYDIYCT